MQYPGKYHFKCNVFYFQFQETLNLMYVNSADFHDIFVNELQKYLLV